MPYGRDFTVMNQCRPHPQNSCELHSTCGSTEGHSSDKSYMFTHYLCQYFDNVLIIIIIIIICRLPACLPIETVDVLIAQYKKLMVLQNRKPNLRMFHVNAFPLCFESTSTR